MPSANNPKSYYASKRIRDAVSNLQKYFGVKSAEDQARALFDPQTGAEGSTAPVDALAALVMDLLMEGVPGDQIVKKLDTFFSSSEDKQLAKDLKAKVQEAVDIYVDGRTSDFGSYDAAKIAKHEMDLGKQNDDQPPDKQADDEENPPKLTIINVKDPTLSPSDRNTGAVDLFLNSMPTHELMQCVPYLDVQLLIGAQALDDQNRLFGLTLPRFILGADTVAEGSATEQMITGDSQTRGVQDRDGKKQVQVTRSGMEIFTSPQTLIPTNTGTGTGDNLLRPTAVLDKFRPLLSIRSFDVNVVPQKGPLSFKDATLELTLHDRSRLHEVSELVRPDNYGTTEIMIEYGWTHPNTTGENAFADIINAMRVKEKFGVMNSSFTFNQNGSVNISLRLFLKGPQECIDTDISEHGSVRSRAKVIEQVISEVSELIDKKNKILSNKKSGRKEVKPSRVIDGALNFNNLIFLGAKSLKNVKKVKTRDARKVTANKKDAKKLQDKLSKLADLANDYNTAANRVLEAKLNLLEASQPEKGKFDDADPFDPQSEKQILLSSIKRKGRGGAGIRPADKKKLLKDKNNPYVSFGKLMSVMVGRPLLKNFSEVQLIFYPFNSRSRCNITKGKKAEVVRPMTIAEFYIRKDLIRDELFRMIKSERTASISLNNFMQQIISEHIEFVGSEPYGIGLTNVEAALLRNPPKGASASDGKLKPRKRRENETKAQTRSRRKHMRKRAVGKVLSAADKKLEKLNEFVKPRVRIMFECMPIAPTEKGQTPADTEQGTLLKVHFFDEMAGKKEVIEQLLDSSQDQSLVNVQRQISDSPKSIKGEESFNAQIAKLTAEDARKKYGVQLKKVKNLEGTRDEFEVVGGYQGLRKFVIENFSSLIYGSSTTGIKNAQFSSMNDSKLNTVHMRRAGRSPNRTVAGQDPGGLPLRVQPTSLSMTTIGCPILQFGQSFFVDFQTATTADDVYSITKLTHRIQPGKFESTLSFVPRQAYGRFQGLMQVIETAQQKLDNAEEEGTEN